MIPTPPSLSAILVRFWLGSLGSFAAGLFVFGRRIFDPLEEGFYCITVGTLAAGVFTLIRVSRAGQALVLVTFFALLQGVLAGWLPAFAGLVLGVGALLVGLIFDLLARRGFWFGKFLISGPLLGGVFLAAAPIAEFDTLTAPGAARTLLEHVFVGVLIGDGVGLGVELADLVAATAEHFGGAQEAPRSGEQADAAEGDPLAAARRRDD